MRGERRGSPWPERDRMCSPEGSESANLGVTKNHCPTERRSSIMAVDLGEG